jgi:hypothetical protein|nr:MAG TPA: Cell wall hydrolase autolysin [Caudoviricetes sp.]
MKILIDNGHGADNYTNGKYSPIVDDMSIESDATVYDHRFREGNFNRLVAAELVTRLRDLGYDAERIVREDRDVPLMARVERVNSWCRRLGKENVLFISVHANAANDGNIWMNARGFSVWVAKQASMASHKLALSFTSAATVAGLMGNRCVPKEHYWQADFFVLKYTQCPAVLTENLFYDNRDDLKIIASPAGREKIVQLHVNAIKNYLNG